MARRGENIYKRKDGRYEGRYVLGKRADGRTKFGYVYARQLGEVQKLLLIKKAALLRQSADFGLEARKSLAEWAEEWLARKLREGLKRSTHQTYSALLRRHILPELGDYLPAAISPELLQNYLQKLESRGLAQSTILVTFRLLSGLLSGAQESGMIRENPCKHLRLRARRAAEQRVLSAEEQRRLLEVSQGPKELPAMLSLYTGMRLGEVSALRWGDVDLERRSVSVRRTAQRLDREGCFGDPGRTQLCVDLPKSASSMRTLPLPAQLLEPLRELRGDASAEDYVFGGARPAEPRTLQRRFQATARRAGLEGVHFHTLRHSFATRMLELGVDIKTISRLLGHSSAQTTLDCYAHSLLDSQRRAIDRLASAMR